MEIAKTQVQFLSFADRLSNSYTEAWKANGRKVLGYYCTDLPEQIIHAAGMLPFRMRGTGNRDFMLSDAILSRFNCTYVRSTLNLALGNHYNFLDGLVVGNTCDHIRRMYDIFGKKLQFNPRFFLSLPHVFSDEGKAWVRKELEQFMLQLSQEFKCEISPKDLRQSLEVYRKNAQLMKQVHDLRQSNEPKLNGSDFIRIAIANSSVRKEYANEQLTQLVPMLKENPPIKKVRARLMVIGSFVDNPDFLEVLEHVGGIVVADSLCLGARSFWDEDLWNKEYNLPEDPIDELVKRCYERSLCPRMVGGHERRLNFIQSQIKNAHIDGVIFERIEFCDLHGCSNMLLQHALEDSAIPTLSLDREYFLGDTGRFKTRVEAFLEKIGR
jgi:benzoyl-CoA reductase subunit C